MLVRLKRRRLRLKRRRRPQRLEHHHKPDPQRRRPHPMHAKHYALRIRDLLRSRMTQSNVFLLLLILHRLLCQAMQATIRLQISSPKKLSVLARNESAQRRLRRRRARNARNPPLMLGLLNGIVGLRNLTFFHRHMMSAKVLASSWDRPLQFRHC